MNNFFGGVLEDMRGWGNDIGEFFSSAESSSDTSVWDEVATKGGGILDSAKELLGNGDGSFGGWDSMDDTQERARLEAELRSVRTAKQGVPYSATRFQSSQSRPVRSADGRQIQYAWTQRLRKYMDQDRMQTSLAN